MLSPLNRVRKRDGTVVVAGRMRIREGAVEGSKTNQRIVLSRQGKGEIAENVGKAMVLIAVTALAKASYRIDVVSHRI